MTERDEDDAAQGGLKRVVDLRIPLWGLLSACAVVGWGLISMYFTLQQLGRDMTEVQVAVKAYTLQNSSTVGDLALLKYRVEKLEAERAREPAPNSSTRR